MSREYAQYRSDDRFTTPTVRWLMILLGGVPIVSALLQPLFVRVLGFPGPLDWLPLSWQGVSWLMIWQPFTYLFVERTGDALTFWFFLRIFFSVYLTWILGGSIAQSLGQRGLLALFFVSGLIAALLALMAMPLMNYYPVIAGSSPAMLGLLVVWTMLNPEAEVLLFFTLPLPARWLAVGLLGIFLLIHGSQGNLVGISLSLGGAVSGYLLALMAWDLRGPFPVTHPFDRRVARLGLTFRQALEKNRRRRGEWEAGTKIFDMKTGKAVYRDEQFMDAMLAKISREGEKSLSWRERWRMRRISKRKRKERSH